MMKNPFESVREELCSRYGLKPEQIDFDIRISGIDKNLAQEIGNDYGNKYQYTDNAIIGDKCSVIHNENFNIYGHYPIKEDEELVIE